MAELRAHRPSLRDQIAWFFANQVGGLGADKYRQQYVAKKVGGLLDFLPGVGEAVGVDDTKRSFNAGNYGEAALNAGTTVMGAVPGGGDLAAGVAKAIFGGIGAKTADMGKLNQAVKMSMDGADRDAIWKDTGWFKGVDGNWRFEIDDSAAHTKGYGPMSDIVSKRGGSVSDTMFHPEFMRAYPDLAANKVQPFTGDARMKGSYNPQDGVVGVNDELRGTDMGSTMLHELQHGVQTREGFGRGAHPDEYASGAMFHEKARNLQGALSQELTGGLTAKPHEILQNIRFLDPERLEGIAKEYGFGSAQEALDFLKIQDELRTPHSQYRRTSGEVEARNVQTRMNMTPEQRRATPPWATQDVPDELQIVRRR